MKVSKRGSRDPEDDTDLEIDDIEDNHHPELETLETTGNPGLPNQLSRDSEDDTDLEIDDIEDNNHPELETLEATGNPGLPSQFSRDSEDDTDLELETVDLVLDQRSRDWIDIVTEQRSQSQDSQNTEDDRSHVR